MIVQFFNRGAGSGAGPINYLLGANRDREKAEVLRGNPEETKALIDSSVYAKKYTCGCLSFEESDIPDEQKRELMTSFEECLFAGLDANQYNCLWVEHRDKNRLELNFVIPNIELTTGKRLQPYFHVADQKRVNAWRTIQNHKYGYSDPDAPEKRQAMTQAKDLPSASKEASEAITNGILNLAQVGRIRSREDVINALENAGLVISRTTSRSISIKNPIGDGRNIRLKGAFYEQDFRFSEDLRAEIEARNRAYRADSERRIEQATSDYTRRIEAKRSDNIKRHQTSKKTIERDSSIPVHVDSVRTFRADVCASNRNNLRGLANQSESTRNIRAEEDAGAIERQNERYHAKNLRIERGQNTDLREDGQRVSKLDMGQGRKIHDFGSEQNEKGQLNDRDGKAIVERIERLREQSQSDRSEHHKRIGEIGEDAENISKRASYFERTTNAIRGAFERVQEYVKAINNALNRAENARYERYAHQQRDDDVGIGY